MIDKMKINLRDLGNMNENEIFQIVTTSNNTVKLSNPGGTKQYFPKEYYSKGLIKSALADVFALG